MPALILMYHDVSDDPDIFPAGHRPYVLEPGVFRRQMESIARSELPILTVGEWYSNPKPPRALILTFDDGHISNYSVVFPVLREFGLKATFFITAGQIGAHGTMDWPQIRELYGAGMEVGSHTLTHRPPSTLSDAELQYELAESRRVLEEGLGAPVTSISSPTGFFNPRIRDIARQTGYRALCIGRAGLAIPEGDAFFLNRVAVKRTTSDKQFRALLRFDRLVIGRMRVRQWVREQARKTLGVDRYLQARRVLLSSGVFNR